MIEARQISLMIETRQLVLRPVAAEDFDDLYGLWSDERFARAVLPVVPGREDVWMRLLCNIGHWHASGFGNWSIRLRSTGAFVGTAGVFDFRRDIEPAFEALEAGWGIAPAHQRQGLGLEAVTAALGWSDAVLGAPRTVCMIGQTNAPSLALAARAGFRPYAQAPYKGEPHVLLERTRSGSIEL